MNPNIEACRQCPVVDNCPLDRRAEQALDEFRDGDIKQTDVRTKIGRVSQTGSRNNCPKREIERVRKELFKVMAPGQYDPHTRISVKPSQTSTHYDSGNYDRLDNGKVNRRKL